MNGLEQEDRLAKWNAIYERDEIDNKPQKELTSSERLTKWNMIYSDAKEVIGPPEQTFLSEVGKRAGMGYIAGEPTKKDDTLPPKPTFAQRWEQAKTNVEEKGMPGFGKFAPILERKGLDVKKAFANLKKQVPEFLESVPSMLKSVMPLTPGGVGYVPPEDMPQRPEYGISGKIERPKKDILKEYGKSVAGGLSTIKDFAVWLPKTGIEFAKDPVGFTEEHPLDVMFLLHVGASVKGKIPKKMSGKEMKTYAEKIPEDVLSQDAKVNINTLLPDDFKLDLTKERRTDLATREKVTKIQEGTLDPGALGVEKLTRRVEDIIKKETAYNKKVKEDMARQEKAIKDVEEGIAGAKEKEFKPSAKELEMAELIKKSKLHTGEPVKPVEPQTKVTPTKGKGVATRVKELEATVPKPSEKTPYGFQDAYQEKIVHGQTKLGEWKEGNQYRYILEGTGDIFREATKPIISWDYIGEKTQRIKRHIENPGHIFNVARIRNLDKFREMKRLWKEQPLETNLQENARQLNIAMLEGDLLKAKKLINKIEQFESKPEIPGQKALELKKALGKAGIVEKHAGFDPFGKKPKDVKQFDFWKKEAIASTIADAKKVKPEPKEVVFDSELPGAEATLAESTPLRTIKNKTIARVATGETNLQDWAKSQGVKGAEQGVFKRLEEGSTIVSVKEAKMLMDKNIPDLKIGEIKPDAFWFKSIRKLAGKVERAFTPSVYIKKTHPVFENLFDMWGIKDRAVTREYKSLKKNTIEPWNKKIAKSGKNPKEAFERVGIYLTGKQKGGDAILKHMKKKMITEADLTPIEKTILTEGRAKFENFFKRINNARERVGRKPLKHVDDYMSWMRNLDELGELGFNLIEDNAMYVDANLRATPFKFAKRRTPVDLPTTIELNFGNVFDSYAHNAMKHINISPVIARGRAYLEPFRLPTGKLSKKGKPETIKWQLKNDKPQLSKALNEWLNAAAGKELGKGTEVQRLMQKGAAKLNKNLATAILSFNLRSAAIQFSAIRGAITKAGISRTIEGIVGNWNPSIRKFIKKWSNLEARNMDIHVAQVIDRTAKGKMENVRRAIGEAGLKPLQLLDMETAQAAWYAFYKKNLKKLGHRMAIREANDAVLTTQASGKIAHVAPIQRIHEGRLITLFQTFNISDWNWVLRDVMGIKNPERNLGTNIVKAIRFMASTAIINHFFEGIVGIPSPFPAPERRIVEGMKEGKPFKKIAIESGRELLEAVPFFGGAIKYSSDYRTQLPSPALQLGADVMTILSKLSKGKVEPTLYELETIGKILGIPGTSQVRKFISRLKQGMSIPKALIGVLPEKKEKFVY